MNPVGRVIGLPSSSADQSFDSFKGASGVGASAEKDTAHTLNVLALKPGGPTVLHDLDIPGSQANIDHVVVSGSKVILLDSKKWKPGFYWTIFGKTFLGLKRVAHADKRTLPMAMDKLESLGVHVNCSYLVVYPSSSRKRLLLLFYRPRGAGVIKGKNLEKRLRVMGGLRSADPNVVSTLAPLVRR